MKSKPPTTNRLVEKAAIGLCVWQLSRRGFETVLTTTNSHEGDIWVSAPDRRMFRVEVKGSTSTLWNIRRAQCRTADFFLLVSIHTARVYVLSRDEIIGNLPLHYSRGDEVYSVTSKRLPTSSLDDWGAFGPTAASFSAMRTDEPLLGDGRTRTVKKRLADGTIKVYRYPMRVNHIQVVNRSDNQTVTPDLTY